MHIVCFGTAQSLEAAGFQKPAPENWQAWYTNDGRAAVVINQNAWTGTAQVFAPTATDILNVLPGWLLEKNSEGWKVWRGRVSFRGFKNPAEAAAAAWFYKNKKK